MTTEPKRHLCGACDAGLPMACTCPDVEPTQGPAVATLHEAEASSGTERETAMADEAERTYGHPLQYALVGPRARYVGNTEHLTDAEISPNVETIERYNRCPTCEQWSPCDVRKAEPDPRA